MKITYIITTCCGDDEAASQRTPSREATMRTRERLLADEILPAALAQPIDEIIVGGRPTDALAEEFEPEGVRFEWIEPVVRWRTEAGHIRRVCAELTDADLFIFSADDHRLASDFADRLRENASHPLRGDGGASWDAWAPARYHALTNERLNNGEVDFGEIDGRPHSHIGYHGFHVNVMRRWLVESVPWDIFPPTLDFQDVPMTDAWRRVGAFLKWGEPLRIYDIEAAEEER